VAGTPGLTQGGLREEIIYDLSTSAMVKSSTATAQASALSG
jgi:hypothetical protein